jgi:hypothetical protein
LFIDKFKLEFKVINKDSAFDKLGLKNKIAKVNKEEDDEIKIDLQEEKYDDIKDNDKYELLKNADI